MSDFMILVSCPMDQRQVAYWAADSNFVVLHCVNY